MSWTEYIEQEMNALDFLCSLDLNKIKKESGINNRKDLFEYILSHYDIPHKDKLTIYDFDDIYESTFEE